MQFSIILHVCLSAMIRQPNTQYMQYKDKSNSSFEDSPSTTVNNPGCYATSQKFIDNPTNEHNDLELCLHTPNSMNSYPTVSSNSNSNGHVASSNSSSAKIYGPHPCEVSSNVKSDWYGTNVTDYSVNSWIASDVTLNYINKLLMQEDNDDRVRLHHGELESMHLEPWKSLSTNSLDRIIQFILTNYHFVTVIF